MPHDDRRVERVSQLIKAQLAELILGRLKDPAVSGVTVSDVRLSGDLSVARVYVSVSGGRDDEALAGLKRATPFLRRHVGVSLHLRRTPELRFMRDEALEEGLRIEAILKEIDEGEES